MVRVWFTDWQVAEDHVLVTTGDLVEWTLFRADADWIIRLFGGDVDVRWQFDTYGDALDQPVRQVRGRVTDLHEVRCPQLATTEGIEPVAGAATLRRVDDTSGSWSRPSADPRRSEVGADGRHAPRRPIPARDGSIGPGHLYGYLVSVAGDPPRPPPPSPPAWETSSPS